MIPEPRKIAKRTYIVGAPTGFQAASGRYLSSISQLGKDGSIGVLDSTGGDSQKLALMSDEDLRRVKTSMPGIVIEPNILYRHWQHPFFEDFESLYEGYGGSSRRVEVRVRSELGSPLPGATVYLLTRIESGRKSGYRGVTDAEGRCRLCISEPSAMFPLLAILPRSNHWSRFIEPVDLRSDSLDVGLKPLPPVDPETYDWGHTCAGMTDGACKGGALVRIGIVDSGIRKDHRDLRPAGGCNCVFNENASHWEIDESGHGTHCAGIVAALLNGYGVKGYVPQAEIYSYRVFPANGDGAATWDILKAIDQAVQDGCDIINMSFGSSEAQTLLRAKMEFAYDHGVLCFAATGNQGASVSFPAGFPSVFGVGAFGKFGEYPEDSSHRRTESSRRSTDGRYFWANFSNFGSKVDFCAPGVAIRSTVPEGYLALDGTSMACPQITGLAALALGSRPDLVNAKRDADRVEDLVKALRQATVPLGFGSEFEGIGFPRVPGLLNN